MFISLVPAHQQPVATQLVFARRTQGGADAVIDGRERHFPSSELRSDPAWPPAAPGICRRTDPPPPTAPPPPPPPTSILRKSAVMIRSLPRNPLHIHEPVAVRVRLLLSRWHVFLPGFADISRLAVTDPASLPRTRYGTWRRFFPDCPVWGTRGAAGSGKRHRRNPLALEISSRSLVVPPRKMYRDRMRVRK